MRLMFMRGYCYNGGMAVAQRNGFAVFCRNMHNARQRRHGGMPPKTDAAYTAVRRRRQTCNVLNSGFGLIAVLSRMSAHFGGYARRHNGNTAQSLLCRMRIKGKAAAFGIRGGLMTMDRTGANYWSRDCRRRLSASCANSGFIGISVVPRQYRHFFGGAVRLCIRRIRLHRRLSALIANIKSGTQPNRRRCHPKTHMPSDALIS